MELSSAFLIANEIIAGGVEAQKKKVLYLTEFSGITENLLVYMNAIYALDNPSLKEVAEKMDVSAASASIAVHKLIKTGFLKKTNINDDKRIVTIFMTDKGNRLIMAQNEAVEVFTKEVIGSFDENERVALNSLYSKLIKRVSDNKFKYNGGHDAN